MVSLNPALVDGAQLVARAVERHAIRAVSTTLSTAIAMASTTSSAPSPSLTSASPTIAAPTSSTSAINGGTTSSGGNNNTGNTNTNGGGGQSSPLLFFVALGFGVVFTNLWIIVGVKYCFRYNARNRQMRLNEDGEPIILENMPRPHRRRREKKLMSIDEVNEKFPMLKYKTWVAGRVEEGLPTQGGVSMPPSRENSIRDVDGVVPELPSKEQQGSTGAAPEPAEPTEPTESMSAATAPAPAHDNETPSTEAQPSTVEAAEPDSPAKLTAETAVDHDHDHHHDEEGEDDEQIDAALPPACMGVAGDACAICIDTLENDDDVRGLTCGHAFHASCLDPWLTTRRACCPLCKADYYTPKPRPNGAEGADGQGTANAATGGESSARQRMNMPTRPPGAWIGLRGLIVHGRVTSPPAEDPPVPPIQLLYNSAQQPRQPSTSNNWLSNLRVQMPFGRRNGGPSSSSSGGQNPAPAASGAETNVSPSELEAGVRHSVSRA